MNKFRAGALAVIENNGTSETEERAWLLFRSLHTSKDGTLPNDLPERSDEMLVLIDSIIGR